MDPTEITVEFLYAKVDKYIDQFVKRFPTLIMRVYFNENGQPPVPPELWDRDSTTMLSGRFVKVFNEYRIGINNQLILPAQLMTFFHEYGHAVYRREANEEIIDEPSLIRTETAAILSSLKLADQEELPDIARLAVTGVLIARQTDKIYDAALKNISSHPLWEKYNSPN